MGIDLVYGFVLFLGLLRHGISVPITPNYYGENPEYQDSVFENYVTEPDSNERLPRTKIASRYHVAGNRWFPRNKLNHRPKKAERRHYHLFHLTAKHPNAVSYHVIEKSPVQRTISAPTQYQSTYNNAPSQQYSTQSYYQQPTTYQTPDYTTPNYPNTGQPKPVDTTYKDILQEVSNPMRFSGNPSSYASHETSTSQNDAVVNNLEGAAAEFNRVSADMNNMELASLVMYPVPPYNDGHVKAPTKKKKSHKKKKKTVKVELDANSEQDKKEEDKPEETPSKGKLLDNLITNDKDKDKDEDMDYDDGSGSGDSWDEEDLSTTADQEYSSSKRSKIPHTVDINSDSDDEEAETSDSQDDKKITVSKKSKIPHVPDTASNSDGDKDENDQKFISSKKSEIPNVLDELSNRDDHEKISSSSVHDEVNSDDDDDDDDEDYDDQNGKPGEK